MENKQMTTTTPIASIFFDGTAFDRAKQACRALATSDLVPDQYRITPNNPAEKAVANCLIALDMASRMRCSPLMVMQNLYIVHGRPSWSSQFLISAVNGCGRFTPLVFFMEEDGEVKIGNKTVPNIICFASAERVGGDGERLIGTTISLKMAVEEGWAGKSGSKWMTMPSQMLKYRAAAFWVRTYAPEVANGFYTEEENTDIYNADAVAMPAEEVAPIAKIERSKDKEALTPLERTRAAMLDAMPNYADIMQEQKAKTIEDVDFETNNQ